MYSPSEYFLIKISPFSPAASYDSALCRVLCQNLLHHVRSQKYFWLAFLLVHKPPFLSQSLNLVPKALFRLL
jgi:hypothetical protein